jgi:hypothetical protein
MVIIVDLRGGGRHILLLANAFPNFIESIAHYHGHAEEVICWSEAPRREVALGGEVLVGSD